VSNTPIKLPRWAKPLRETARYKILYGGRGGGKSYAVADQLLIDAALKPHRILCAREYQASIKDSVHRLLADRIEACGLSSVYEVQRDAIYCRNGSAFIFRGVRHNVQSIKSMTGITRVWVEEAQTVSEESWRILLPTIRDEGSEVWLTLNPHKKQDATSQRFIEHTPTDAIKIKINWDGNPHFPETLNAERLRDQERLDPSTYAHIWDGAYIENTAAQVLADKVRVAEFEAGDWDGPYYGADWGFSQDPTTLVRCWLHDGCLWIDYEAYQVGLDIDRTAELFDTIPGARSHTIRADSARPETISYMQRHGYPRLTGVTKWAGSVEDGLQHLRSYREIVIHPRCKHAIEESRLYSYKVDRLSGDILPTLVDAHNHIIDAVRYALAPMIRQRTDIFEFI
jgi:phage terminase large subunit